VLVKREVHSLPAKSDAFHPKTKVLFSAGFPTKFDFASRAHHALPRKLIGRTGSEQASYRAMVERVSGGSGHLTVGGDFSSWDGENDTPKSSITEFVRARAAFQDTAVEITTSTVLRHSMIVGRHESSCTGLGEPECSSLPSIMMPDRLIGNEPGHASNGCA